MSDNSPDKLTANMLRKEFYVVTTTPARAPGIAEVLPAHLEYQVQMEREGKLFGAGPFFEEGNETPSGGLIILRASSYDEARALADADPFHAAGLRSYTIQKWMMNEGGLKLSVRFSDQSVVIE